MDHKKNVYRKTKGAKITLRHHVTKEESPKNLPDCKDGTEVTHAFNLVSRMKKNNTPFASKKQNCLVTYLPNRPDKKGMEKRPYWNIK